MSSNPSHDHQDETVTTHKQYVEVLRTGGFVCFIPHVIDPNWQEPAPLLAGFPISICFTGLAAGPSHAPGMAVTSCYWFDPASFHEDDQIREMTYYSKPRNEYRVQLVQHKHQCRWEGRKYRGAEILLTASSVELRQVVIHLNMQGIDRGEQVQPLLTCKETASMGVYIFSPKSTSCPIESGTLNSP